MDDNWVYQVEGWKEDQEALLLQETIFHNANGYLGVRSNFEEGYPNSWDSIRGMYVNGFYDIAEMKQAERLHGLVEEKQTMLNVADFQAISLWIDGEKFSLFQGQVLKYRRVLDMKKGFTLRHVAWRSPQGREVEVWIKRMASFAMRNLFTIEYKVRPLNFQGEIRWESVHQGDVMNYSNPNDPRVAAESQAHLVVRKVEEESGASYIVADTVRSGLGLCTGAVHVVRRGLEVFKDCVPDAQVVEGSRCIKTFRLHLGQNQEASLAKYGVVADSIRCQDYTKKAKQVLGEALSMGLERLYESQEKYLEDYWASASLSIEGDQDLNIAIRYNLYQLLQSVGKDSHSNIAAKGLSGEGYEGHFFWDTEMYIVPFFLLTKPGLARNLLSFRYATLRQAKENAKALGHGKGALYPWRTMNGKECSGHYPSGTAQYHISGDIAYGVVQYYLATGDRKFLEEMGGEMVVETARLWDDMASFAKGEYHLNCVTGPDEYTCMVNDNFYTNLLARYNLEWALKVADMLGAERYGLTRQELEHMRQVAEKIHVPYDQELGINPQDDSFLQKPVWDFAHTPAKDYPLLLHYHPLHIDRHQVVKQADAVLAYFILEDYADPGAMEKSFAYYEKITTHDSSLSTCIHSIVAAKLGMVEKAYQYFGESAKLDLFNTHKNTKDGIHTANMGGNYMAVVYGFGGLRIKEKGLCLAPVLPGAWRGYAFRIQYQGRALEIRVGRKKVEVKRLCGEPMGYYLFGKYAVV